MLWQKPRRWRLAGYPAGFGPVLGCTAYHIGCSLRPSVVMEIVVLRTRCSTLQCNVPESCLHTCWPQILNLTRQGSIHYILRAHRGSHVTTLGQKYLLTRLHGPCGYLLSVQARWSRNYIVVMSCHLSARTSSKQRG